MTSDPPRSLALALALLAAGMASAAAAEPSYPFEGTWVRANRICAANAPRVRTYTAKDVTFPSGRCTFRKVATGGGLFEIFEDCRRAEHAGSYTETIRMLGPDVLQMRRSAGRLKIGRPLRYARCSAAAPAPAGALHPAPHHPASVGEPRGAEPKPVEPKPVEPKPADQKAPDARP